MISAYITLFVGLLVLPAYTLQTSLSARAIQYCISIVFLLCSGRRILIGTNALLVAAIVLVHLFVPSGLVLAKVGGFPLTSGALELGLHKALLIGGLVFISRFAVRMDSIPFRSGTSLIALVLTYFESFTRGTGALRRRKKRVAGEPNRFPRSTSALIRRIDEVLLSQNRRFTERSEKKPVSTKLSKVRSLLIAVVFLILHWLVFAIGTTGTLPELSDLFQVDQLPL